MLKSVNGISGVRCRYQANALIGKNLYLCTLISAILKI